MPGRYHEPWRESTLPRIPSGIGLSPDTRTQWTKLIARTNSEQKAYVDRAVPRSTEPFSLERAVLRRAAMQTDLFLEVPAPARTLLAMMREGRLSKPATDVVVNRCPLGGAETFAIVEEAAKAPAVVAESKPDVLEVYAEDPFGDITSEQFVAQESISPIAGASRTRRSSSFYAVDTVEYQMRKASVRTVRGKSFSDALCCGKGESRSLRSRLPLTAPKEPCEAGYAVASGSRDLALRAGAKLCADAREQRDEALRRQLQQHHSPKALVEDASPVDLAYRQYAPVPQVERARCDKAFTENDDYLFLTHDHVFHAVADAEERQISPCGSAGSAADGDGENDDEDDVVWRAQGLADNSSSSQSAIKLRMKRSLKAANERVEAIHREHMSSRGTPPPPHSSMQGRPVAGSGREVALVIHGERGGGEAPSRRHSPQPHISDRLLLLSMPPPRKIQPETKTCDEYKEVKARLLRQSQDDAIVVRNVTLPVYLNLRSFV